MRRVEVRLQFDGPVLSAGLGSHRAGLDAAFRRNAANQRCIPAAHWRGRVREAMIEMLLATARPPEDEDETSWAERRVGWLFGRGEDDAGRGLRSRVRFSDLVEGQPHTEEQGQESLVKATEAHVAAPERATGTERRRSQHRVSIDRRTGTAGEGLLFESEGDAPGDRHSFYGTIDLRLPSNAADDLCDLVAHAVRWVEHLGRSGSIGWGRITEYRIEPAPSMDLERVRGALARLSDAEDETTRRPAWSLPTQSISDWEEIPVLLALHGPLAIPAGRAGSNVFESRYDIPGSVLRRALADVVLVAAGRRRGGWVGSLGPELPDALRPLADNFAQVQASYLFPSVDQVRPETRPSSTVWLRHPEDPDREDPLDLVALLEPHTLEDGVQDGRPTPEQALARGRILASAIGGRKSTSGIDKHRGDPAMPTTLRTHVAKDRRTHAARQGQLYSIQAVLPRWDRDKTTRRKRYTGSVRSGSSRTHFMGRVRFPKEVAGLAEAVRLALSRVQHIGKAIGRGYGAVRVFETSASPSPSQERLQAWNERNRSSHYTVPLLLLTEALLLDVPWTRGVGCHLGPVYHRLWCELLNIPEPLRPEVRLSLHMATHRLRGGVTAAGQGATPPVLLTQAGATFLLRVPRTFEHQVRNRVEELCTTGVERPELLTRTSELWGARYVPLCAADGCGELTVHPPPSPELTDDR